MREDDFIRRIKISDRIFIYGAGMVGTLVLLRLRANSISNEKITVLVSKSKPGQTCLGLPVYGVEQCEWWGNYSVIVATLPKNQKQITDTLRENGIDEFIPIDDELYEDMERNYISDYIKSHNRVEGDRDVLFMSSDNNYSSGAFLCMVDLCKGMMSREIKPLVVLPGYGNGVQLLEHNDIEFTFVQSRGPLIENGKEPYESPINSDAIEKIERLIKEHNIKILHNNSNHGYIGTVAARNIHVPYVWHIRENVYEQGFVFFDETYIYELINQADRVVSVSEYVRDCYKGLNKERVSTIYDGIEIEKYYRKRSILKSEKISILMPGIMVPLKGQHQLLKAAVELERQGVDFDISFVGSGDADYLKMLEDETEKHNLGGRIHFYERVNDIENWYSRADVVAVCSRSEAFGRVTIEAQLAGCVVVGAGCGATVELVEDGVTGYLYELDNTAMLAEKIKQIYDNRQDAENVAENGQKKAIEKYDKRYNCEKIIDIYHEILGQNE